MCHSNEEENKYGLVYAAVSSVTLILRAFRLVSGRKTGIWHFIRRDV